MGPGKSLVGSGEAQWGSGGAQWVMVGSGGMFIDTVIAVSSE